MNDFNFIFIKIILFWQRKIIEESSINKTNDFLIFFLFILFKIFRNNLNHVNIVNVKEKVHFFSIVEIMRNILQEEFEKRKRGHFSKFFIYKRNLVKIKLKILKNISRKWRWLGINILHKNMIAQNIEGIKNCLFVFIGCNNLNQFWYKDAFFFLFINIEIHILSKKIFKENEVLSNGIEIFRVLLYHTLLYLH